MPPLMVVRVAASICSAVLLRARSGLANGALCGQESDRAPCALLARAFEMARAAVANGSCAEQDARCRSQRSYYKRQTPRPKVCVPT